MKKIESNLPLILAGIGLLLLLGMIAQVVFTLPPRTFTMLTGRVGGAYYEGAVLYRDFAAQNGFTIDIVETAGSARRCACLKRAKAMSPSFKAV